MPVRMRRPWRAEEGQSLVIIALAMVTLLGMLALIVDGGYAYALHRRAQNAADLAALAGARALAMGLSEAEIEQEITYYAEANGADSVAFSYVDDNGVQVSSPSSARGVRVSTQIAFETFLARVVGLSQMSVAAAGEARFFGVAGTDNLLPIAVYEDDFQFGVTYDLWDSNPEAPGAFGWLDWNGGSLGTMELANNIANPSNSGYWEVGDLVPAKTGIAVGAPVRNALNQWIGEEVTVVIYDQVTGQGANTRFRISGFGKFVLEGYIFRGANKRIWGYFVTRVTRGVPGEDDFGLRVIQLVD